MRQQISDANSSMQCSAVTVGLCCWWVYLG